MSAGPSNTTPTSDYGATIAPSFAGPGITAVGSAINFPRLSAPIVGAIAINNPGPLQSNNTAFILPSVGTYRISWHISVDEAAQWSLWISTNDTGTTVVVPPPDNTALFSQFRTDAAGNYSILGTGAPGQIGQATGTSQLKGEVIIRNPTAGAAIQIRNYAAADGAALTVTPLPGGSQAQSAVLTIIRLN